MAFCTNCGTQMPDGAVACPSCGRATGPAAAPAAAAGAGLDDNVAGLLAYLLIPAIIFLVMEPYNRRNFIRFHSFQSIFVCIALFALNIVLTIFGMIPVLGLLVIPIGFIIWLGSFILWIVLMIKAFQGQRFKLPIIGDLAEKQANAA